MATQAKESLKSARSDAPATRRPPAQNVVLPAGNGIVNRCRPNNFTARCSIAVVRSLPTAQSSPDCPWFTQAVMTRETR
ncbi:MAG: hypothetical protein ACFB0G_20670 [Leptolyngbyaceae cyanobacterium]